jgi:hypothetical protein
MSNGGEREGEQTTDVKKCQIIQKREHMTQYEQNQSNHD